MKPAQCHATISGNSRRVWSKGKEKGKTQREELAEIERIAPPYHRAERKIMRDIVRQLYTARYATHFTPDGAFAAYKAECSAQQ